MFLNLMTVPDRSKYGKVIDRSWIVKGPSNARLPAKEGVDFTLTEDDTKFSMPINQYFTIIMLPSRAVEAAGKKNPCTSSSTSVAPYKLACGKMDLHLLLTSEQAGIQPDAITMRMGRTDM